MVKVNPSYNPLNFRVIRRGELGEALVRRSLILFSKTQSFQVHLNGRIMCSVAIIAVTSLRYDLSGSPLISFGTT